MDAPVGLGHRAIRSEISVRIARRRAGLAVERWSQADVERGLAGEV
jgi:hypothetical protein